MTDRDAELAALGELYQEMILDHSRRPRNYGRPPDADRTAEGHNPLCGDRYVVWVRVEREKVASVGFEGTGCAISRASASLMTVAVQGLRLPQMRELAERFGRLVRGEGSAEGLGKLVVFEGVSKFPVRVKCATLAWHTLAAALEGRAQTVSTE